MERQPQPPYRDEDMLTRVELAQALKISTRTVDRYISEGTGPPYSKLPGGSVRFRWADVREWLRLRRIDG
jgi:excisionase family DNA binding protein